MRSQLHVYGLLAEFDDPDRLLDAARAAHRAGYKKMDGYSPFPIHGLSSALGLRHTRLPLIVLCGGLIGCFGGFFMQWFANVIHYPLNIGGRPNNSWPAFIIITFETTILFAGIFAVLGMLALNGLPQPYHPLFNMHNFELASRTHFFLCIEAIDPKFDLQKTAEFLKSLGASSVAVVPAGKLQKPVATATGQSTSTTLPSILLLCVATLALLGGCSDPADNELFKMDDYGRLTPMEPSAAFPDGSSVRPIIEGTVARGDARLDPHLYTGKVNGKDADTFPFPITKAVLERGRERFQINCAHCHNDTGDGNGMIVRRGFTRPPAYYPLPEHSPTGAHPDAALYAREQGLLKAPVGHFFDVITNGWGAMYSHGDRVQAVEDRWAIAAYIRVLQLAGNPDMNLLPAEDQQKLATAQQSIAGGAPTTAPAPAAGEAH